MRLALDQALRIKYGPGKNEPQEGISVKITDFGFLAKL
jgi:hypothetical protein